MMNPARDSPRHPLIDAIAQQDIDSVTALLVAGADPNQTAIGVPALGWAVQLSEQTAREPIVGALLHAGADPSPALIAIAAQANEHAIDALLVAGADVNTVGGGSETALIAAVKGGNLPAIERLCEAGARVNQTDETGRAPLRWLASLSDRPDAARVLIAHGADVNLGDRDGTPLATAAFLGAAETVAVLLAAGADPHLPAERFDATPLTLAAERGHHEIVRRLIASGAAVNRRDQAGWTAAMFAAREGHLPVLRLLAQAGADLRVTSDAGDTPLNLAEENGNDGVVAFLKQRIPNP